MAEPRHFRATERTPMSLRVRFRVGVAYEHVATTSDIGLGGAYVLTSTPPGVGDEVTLILDAPTAWDPLQIGGTTRWARRGADAPPHGFGMEFHPLAATTAGALLDFLIASGYAEAPT